MENKTKVIIARPSEWVNRLRPIRIFIDGTEAASLKNGSSEEIAVSPGSHKIYGRLSWFYSTEFEVDIKQNEVVYLRTRSSLRLYWPLYFLLIAGILFTYVLKKNSPDYRPVWLIWIEFASILPFVLYMFYYLTLGRKKYLVIEEDKDNVFAS
jgi:hypothetical protein